MVAGEPIPGGSFTAFGWIEREPGPAAVVWTIALDTPDLIERVTTLIDTVAFE